MIRVGFILIDNGDGWVGGINYMSNLLHAIASVENRQIEPVLIVSPSTPASMLAAFPSCPVLHTVLAGGRHRGWTLARKLSKMLCGRDVLLERYLRRHRIDVLSHSGELGRSSTVPTIGWIPDFQHRRIPSFFQAAELASRDRSFRKISEHCTTVLLSSVDAQNDLAKFDSVSIPKSRVLHFVSGFGGEKTAVADEVFLRERYKLVGPYFHLPNQFWVHKNHRVVIEALALLKKSGQKMLIVCTGHTNDGRWPGYFDDLMRQVDELGIADYFRVLGLVPYAHMTGLMKHSVGVINPSVFEGWSTTVEEAKSLGLTVVLSDIPVHREQNPKRGHFFHPQSPPALAATLINIAAHNDCVKEKNFAEVAAQEVSRHFSEFGVGYQKIAIETISKKSVT